MVKFLKKCFGKLLRCIFIPFLEPICFFLMIYKYADQKAINRKAILDRLADRGGRKNKVKR